MRHVSLQRSAPDPGTSRKREHHNALVGIPYALLVHSAGEEENKGDEGDGEETLSKVTGVGELRDIR